MLNINCNVDRFDLAHQLCIVELTNMPCLPAALLLLSAHPGIADSTWYLKSDNKSYLFSYLVHRARSLLGSGLVRVGQPVQTGARTGVPRP
jgi:hypothetical protein